MSNGEEKQTALAPAQSTALTKAAAKSLVARGRADLRVKDLADDWLRKGLELRDQERNEEAFTCFEQGIRLNPNHAEIQFILGVSYEEGNGVGQDCAHAAVWYRRAAGQGKADAQRSLEHLYEMPYWKDVRQKRTNDMTTDEIIADMQFDNPTGLLSMHSFKWDQEDSPAPFIALSELDAHKTFRNEFGNEVGLRLMRVIAEAAKQVGLDPYLLHDEVLLYRGNSKEELTGKLETVRAILRNWKFDAQNRHTGQAYEIEGVDFFFGIGSDRHTAHSDYIRQKNDRETKFGQLRGEFWGCYEVRLK